MRPSRVLAIPNMPFVVHARFLLLLQEAFLVSFMLTIFAQDAQQDVCLAPLSWCHYYPRSHEYLVNMENQLTSHWCSPCASIVSWVLGLPSLSPFHLHFP